jgi:hypothetical protein
VVVHHGLTASPSADVLPEQHTVFTLVAEGDDEHNLTIREGPAPKPWDEFDVFGEPEPNGPALRFEAVDEDCVDVIAPVLDDEWVLRVTLRRRDDDVVVEHIELSARPGADHIGSRVLRRLGFGSVQKAATTVLLHHPEVTRYLGESWTRPVSQPGKAGRKDAFYAEWARRYVEARHEDPHRPIAWLLARANEDGEPLTVGKVRARLGAARERGLLTEAPLGQAGGELTDKARRLLGMDQEEGDDGVD